MAPGTVVSDLRIGRRVGYWDGEMVTKDLSAAVKTAARRNAGLGGWDWPTIGLVGAAVVLIGFVVWRYCRPASA